MLPRIDGQYLILLSQPLNEPGVNARSAGYFGQHYDAGFNQVGQSLDIRVKLPLRVLPNPGYLFSLGIDPHSCQKGLEEIKALEQINALLSSDNLDVFTWSSRHLESIDAACLRNFRKASLLYSCRSLTDLNVVLKVCALFGSLKIKATESLKDAALQLGYSGSFVKGVNSDRTAALMHILKTISENDPAILQFFMHSVQAKVDLIKRTIAQGKFLVDVDSKGTLEVVKPLNIEDHLLESVCCNGSEVYLKYLKLSDSPLLAPVSLLTEQRQMDNNFSLAHAIEMIKSCDLTALAKPRLPFQYLFFKQLSDAEKQDYQKNLNKDPRAIDMLMSGSGQYRSLAFLCRADNSSGSLVENERISFENFTIKEIRQHINEYLTGCKSLRSIADPENEADTALYNRIERYPYDL